VNLLDLIHSDGGTLRKVAITNGGEYAGACPFCGGNDRFRLWPEDRGGRYWCRGCGTSGDAIQYLRDYRNLSFAEACAILGHDPGPRSPGARPAPAAAWTPRETTAPPEAWQEKARGFLDDAIDLLWTPAGALMRAWLRNEKGLQDATIRAAGPGLTWPTNTNHGHPGGFQRHIERTAPSAVNGYRRGLSFLTLSGALSTDCGSGAMIRAAGHGMLS